VTAISDEAIRNSQRTDPVLANLVSVDDPDWAKFQTDDPEWFLRAAGRAARKFCGWHLAPNIRQHITKVEVGAHGICMLPSRYVTEVEELTITCGQHPHRVRHSEFRWDEEGWIQLRTEPDWYSAGYVYGNDPSYLPVTQPGIATVTMWHGFHVLPEDVKEVCFELAQSALILKTGNVKTLATPGEYRLELSQDAGLTLNCDQRNRLGPYRIQPIG
jgi:hypothetical protein